MVTYSITLSDAEDEALRTEVLEPQEFFDNFAHERCRVAMDKIHAKEREYVDEFILGGAS